MPTIDPDFNRSCVRLDLAEEHSGIFTPREPTLKFTDADLLRFNECAARIAPGTPPLDAFQIAGAARRLSRAVGAGRESRFIQIRMRRVGEIRALLADAWWNCEGQLRERMCELVVYIDTAPGLIPDGIPVIGALDDALLVDLAMEGLRGELDEYADFCRYRGGEAARLGIKPEEVALDRAAWTTQREEELRMEQQLRRTRGESYARDDGGGGHFRVR